MKELLRFAKLGAREDSSQCVNASNVRQAVVDRAKQMRQTISERIKRKKVSISADFASLHGNEFLGKNFC